MTHRHPPTQLDRIERNTRLAVNLAASSVYQGAKIMARQEDLEAAMVELAETAAANGDRVASAVIVLNSISARLDAAAGDPTRVKAISASLRANAEALGVAIDAVPPAPPAP